MPGDAANLGRGFVEVHLKLDEYDAEIASLERRTTPALKRVQDSASEASDAGSALSQGAESAIQKVIEPTETIFEVIGRILASVVLFNFVPPMLDLIGRGARVAGRNFALMGQALANIAADIPVLGPALSSTISAFSVAAARAGRHLGVLAPLMATLIRLVGFLRNAAIVAAGAVGTVLSALVAPVAILASVGALVQILQKIPGVAAAAFNALKNLTFQDVVDGIVSLTTSIGSLLLKIPLIGAGFIKTLSVGSQLFGGPDIEKELNDAREFVRIERLKQDARAQAAQAFVRDTQLIAAAEAERRRASLVGLSGPDRVRQEELFNQADIARQGEEAGDKYYQQFLAAIRKNKTQLDAGDIDQETFDFNRQALQEGLTRQMEQNQRDLDDALASARAAGAARLAEGERVDRLARAARLEVINSEILQAALKSQGLSFDARAEAIRIGYQMQITQAEEQGNALLVARLRELSQARIQAVRKAERERWDAQIDEAERGARRVLDRIRGASEDIERIELELSMPKGPARTLALGEFDIDKRADADIRRSKDAIARLQDERLKLNNSLTTMQDLEQVRALSNQIGLQNTLIAQTEKRRDLEKELAKQRLAERVGFRQIDERNIVTGSVVKTDSGGPGGSAGRDQLRFSRLNHEQLVAIRKAVESRNIGGVFN